MRIVTKPATDKKKLTVVWGLHKMPFGETLIAQSADGLCFIGIDCGKKALARHFPGANLVEDAAVTDKIARAMRKGFPDKIDLPLPVVLYGTPFQHKVWKELLKIKCGKTTHYGTIAQKIGQPTASRAVGSAVGKNPVSILVPCHRVVNKDGARMNYAWGVPVKKALLKAEGAL